MTSQEKNIIYNEMIEKFKWYEQENNKGCGFNEMFLKASTSFSAVCKLAASLLVPGRGYCLYVKHEKGFYVVFNRQTNRPLYKVEAY